MMPRYGERIPETCAEPAPEVAQIVQRLKDTAAGIEAGNTADPHGRKVGLLREAADALAAAEARAAKAERTLHLHAGDVTSAQLEANREHERAEEAEASNARLEKALRMIRQLHPEAGSATVMIIDEALAEWDRKYG